MSVRRLVGLMRSLELEPTKEDILDILWLAPHIGQPAADPSHDDERARRTPPVPVEETSEPTTAAPPPRPSERARRRPPTAVTGDRDAYRGHSLYLMTRTGHGGLYAAEVRAPAASALADQLALARAMRPLKRKVPSSHSFYIDEEATADLIATDDLWIPALLPAPDRWLELAVVVDAYESMVIWRQLITEFRRVLEGLGVFSDVRFWALDSRTEGSSPQPGLRHGGRVSPLRSPGELTDPAGRRAIAVISDCLGPLWRSGAAQRQLAEWGRSQPVAILQPLPQRLWIHSHARPSPVNLRAPRPGIPNARLEGIGRLQAQGASKDSVPIPVLELGPDWLASWSRLVSASGSDGVYSMAVFVSPESGMVKAGPGLAGHKTASDPQAFLESFRAMVSPEAYQLAIYLAAAPVSLPIIRLIQQAMLNRSSPDRSSQSQVAEVFLSGLLCRGDPDAAAEPDMIQYDFAVTGVRELLLRRLRRTDAIRVLLAVSDFMGARFGQTLDFRALLAGHGINGSHAIGRESRPFALVAEQVLRLLGGQYMTQANQLAEALEDRKPVGPGEHEESEPGERLAFLATDGEMVEIRATAAASADPAPDRLAMRRIQLIDGTELRQILADERSGWDGYEALDNEILAGLQLAKTTTAAHPAQYPAELSCLYGYEPHSARPFALLRPYRGRPLAEVGRQLLPDEQRQFMISLLSGLCWLAEAGIAHRGISPSTVRWDGRHVQITDFSQATVTGTPRTETGMAPWAAPEQRRGRAEGMVSDKDDIWAAGHLIFYMHTGEEFTNWSQLVGMPVLEELLGRVIGPADGRPSASDMLARLGETSPVPQWTDADGPLEEGYRRFYASRARKHPPSLSDQPREPVSGRVSPADEAPDGGELRPKSRWWFRRPPGAEATMLTMLAVIGWLTR